MVTAQGVHPDSFEYRWVAAVIRATEQRAAVASRWNGQVFIEPEHAGSAQEDGSFGVSQEILDLAGRAYRGEQLDDDELDTLRAGVATTVHEAKHLTSWPGDLSAPDAAQLHAPDVVSLEEGLAEEFAQQNTDDVIRDIGMDQVVPGLAGREQDDSSPAYTNATEQLVNGLAELGKADPEYVRQNLSATGRAQRWNASADFLISKRLNGLMPEEHRAAVRSQLVAAMRTQFAPVRALHESDRDEVSKAIAGHRQGGQTVAAVQGTLERIETHYREWHAGQAAQAQPQAQQGDVDHLRQFLQDEPTVRLGTAPATEAATGERHQVRPRRGFGVAD